MTIGEFSGDGRAAGDFVAVAELRVIGTSPLLVDGWRFDGALHVQMLREYVDRALRDR